MKLSVILPAFNEEKNVRTVLREVDRTLEKAGIEHELIAVDDGSIDGTWKELKVAASEIEDLKLIRCENNNGKGYALKLGFEASTGDLVAFFDTGGEYPTKSLIQFLKLIEEDGTDAVIGSKRHPKSRVGYPTRRIFWSTVHNLAVRILLRLPVRDTQVGLKIFRRKVLEKVIPLLLVKRYAFDVELLANIHQMGYKIREAPIALNFNPESERIRFKDIFRIALDILAIFYRMRILKYYDRCRSELKWR